MHRADIIGGDAGVYGEICAGVYIPKSCVVPMSSGGGGGTMLPTKKTAEDFMRVYIDSDMSQSTGLRVSTGSYAIGADYMVEIRGLCCEISSVTLNIYEDGDWSELSVQVDAAKDESRMEIGVPSSVIGGASQIDFVIETTDWSGDTDTAPTEAYEITMRTWAVDSSGPTSTATQTSNQRKVFQDGANFWSFYIEMDPTRYTPTARTGA